MLRVIKVSCLCVIIVFLAIRQGIAEDVGKIFKSRYQATMESFEADSDIKTYINDTLAEKRDSEKIVVGNPELMNETTDALVRGANGMLVCHTYCLLRILTEVSSLEWLFKLKIYAARSVTLIFAKQFANSQKFYLSRIDKFGNAKLAKKNIHTEICWERSMSREWLALVEKGNRK